MNTLQWFTPTNSGMDQYYRRVKFVLLQKPRELFARKQLLAFERVMFQLDYEQNATLCVPQWVIAYFCGLMYLHTSQESPV